MSDSNKSIDDFEILTDSEWTDSESPIPSPPTTPPPPVPPNSPLAEFIAPHFEYASYNAEPARWCGLGYITDAFLEFLLFVGCIRVG